MKKKVIIIVFVIGVILIGCGIGIYFMGGNTENKDKTETKNEEPEGYMNVKSPDTDYYKWQKIDRENYLKEIYRTIGCYMEVNDKEQFKKAIENIFSEGVQQ